MFRVSLTNGGWFDLDKAKEYKESFTHDGRNFISDATGTQWDHQCLYETAKGSWVLRSWSDWQGSKESFAKVSEDLASQWLISCGHEIPKSLSKFAEGAEV